MNEFLEMVTGWKNSCLQHNHNTLSFSYSQSQGA